MRTDPNEVRLVNLTYKNLNSLQPLPPLLPQLLTFVSYPSPFLSYNFFSSVTGPTKPTYKAEFSVTTFLQNVAVSNQANSSAWLPEIPALPPGVTQEVQLGF